MNEITTHFRPQPTALTLVFCLLGSGCGYTIGNAFPPEVRSVHVPLFTSDSFRRDVHLQLTEAVQKEIVDRTHYRLAKEANADTQLTGRIVEIRKNVISETAFDDPRQLEFSIALEVTWEDLNSGRILRQQRIPVSPEASQFLVTSSFAPEVGQSLATAKQAAYQKLAAQVVNAMETPW